MKIFATDNWRENLRLALDFAIGKDVSFLWNESGHFAIADQGETFPVGMTYMDDMLLKSTADAESAFEDFATSEFYFMDKN